MKLITFLVIFSSVLVSAVETIQTNSKLPENRVLWPMPEERENALVVDATFVSETEVSSIAQGNWRKVIKLVTYQATDSFEGSPDGRIVFVVEDAFPMEGSRIKVKRLPWPFHTGKMRFFLKRDEACLLKPFFKISAYQTIGRLSRSLTH